MSAPEFYIDGVPMKVSKSFEPVFTGDLSLPSIPRRPLNYDVNYDFNVENFAMSEARRRDEEICKEAERVRMRMMKIMDQKEKEKEIKKKNIASSNASAFNNHTHSHSHPNLHGISDHVQPQLTTSIPPPPSTLTSSIFPPMSVASTALDGTRSSSFPLPVVANNSASSSVVNSTQRPVKPMINLSDFDPSSGSSPFDDALLKAIDDRSELHQIFNHQHHNNRHHHQDYNGAKK